jgi:hypothetical protein
MVSPTSVIKQTKESTGTRSIKEHPTFFTTNHKYITQTSKRKDIITMAVAAQRISNVCQRNRDSEEGRHERKASLSDVERVVLSALLIDTPTASTSSLSNPETSIRVLNDDMLFSIPQGLSEKDDHHDSTDNYLSMKLDTEFSPKRPSIKKNPKDYRLHVGLWQAHEDGVTSKFFSRMASIASSTKELDGVDEISVTDTDNNNNNNKESFDFENDDDDDDDDGSSSIKSLRGSQSSEVWDEDESTVEHFDAWQVLKDEYAQEYGFDYRPGSSYFDESEIAHNQFKIIGTSAEDKSSHPHVVSPPLLDSIMTYLPEVCTKKNLRFFFSAVFALETYRFLSLL